MQHRLRAVFLFAATVTIVACTATQRGWVHDNVPLIGLLFDPIIPPPAIPLWHGLLSIVAGWFANSPEIAIPTVGVAVGAAQHGIKGLPWTKRAATLKDQRRAAREQQKKEKAAAEATKAHDAMHSQTK